MRHGGNGHTPLSMQVICFGAKTDKQSHGTSDSSPSLDVRRRHPHGDTSTRAAAPPSLWEGFSFPAAQHLGTVARFCSGKKVEVRTNRSGIFK